MITKDQKEARKKGVGASDSPIIMGFSHYKTPYVLYLEKLGLLREDDEIETEQQFWGNTLEPVIRQHFSTKNNVIVTMPDTMYHIDKPYMLANLDGFIPEWNAVVEVKNSSAFMRSDWGDQGTDFVPMLYLIQVAHQCIVTEADKGFIAVLIGGNEYRQFEYKRDSELESLIIDCVDRFWLKNVLQRKEPDSICIEDSRLKYKDAHINSKKCADEGIKEELEVLANTKEERKKLEKIEEMAKMSIMEYMQHSECLTDESGRPLVTLKPNARGNRVFLLK